MTDWQSPEILLLTSGIFIRVLHFTAGVFFWEVFSTLWFEWQVYTGKRKFMWTTVMYTACRVCGLGVTLVTMVGFDTTEPLNCNAWWAMMFIFQNAALLLSTTFLILRVIAFWDRNPWIMIPLSTLVVGDGALMLAYMVQVRGQYDPLAKACLLFHSELGVYSSWLILFTDFTLMVMMLVGIKRMKYTGGLWAVVYKQGMVWMFAATIAYIPSVVLVKLNLNGPMSFMAQPPAVTTIIMCATRMYRGLLDHTTSTVLVNRSGNNAAAFGDITVSQTFIRTVDGPSQHQLKEFRRKDKDEFSDV